MTPRVVAVFVGTRADLGPLGPVISAVTDAPDLTLKVLTGVMYAAHDLAAALPGPRSAEDWLRSIVPLAAPMQAVTPESEVAQGALLAAATGRAIRAERVDVLVVLGDRWELLDVVPPAFLLGVPIVHLHGGEVTEGAVDERVRHAVTKLADEHCVASVDAAARLRQLGEPPDRVHVTGAPGLDRLVSAEAMTDADSQRLRDAGFSDRQIVDITLAAAARNYFSRALQALAVPVDPMPGLSVAVTEALTGGTAARRTDGSAPPADR